MNQILFINSCVRPDSRTYALARHLLEKLHGQVEEVCLEREPIPPLTWASLQDRDAQVKARDYSGPMFRYARQFAQADVIVLAAPYWDLAFPASVKAYFEAVTVLGLTFFYTPEGRPAGLCRAQKAPLCGNRRRADARNKSRLRLCQGPGFNVLWYPRGSILRGGKPGYHRGRRARRPGAGQTGD